MGYDLHITRREDWADDDDVNKISLEEWLTYVESDDTLELANGYVIKIPGTENTFQNAPGFCNWSGHSVMKGDSRPWFDHWHGCISTKNPDLETIRKMINMAKALNAKVQGDDGEIYDETYYSNQRSASEKAERAIRKPWWKFW